MAADKADDHSAILVSEMELKISTAINRGHWIILVPGDLHNKVLTAGATRSQSQRGFGTTLLAPQLGREWSKE